MQSYATIYNVLTYIHNIKFIPIYKIWLYNQL